MLFLSDRSGYEELYVLEPEEAGKKIAQSTRFKVQRILETHDGVVGANFTPDGKRVSFVKNGKLFTMNPDGTDLKTLVDKQQVIDYEWSPDSHWLAYARLDGSSASEIYIMPAAGGESKNVTRFATFNAGITWSQTGMKLAFLSERHNGGLGMYVISLQKPAASGAPETNDIDFDDVHLRAELAAPIGAQQGAISKDGTRVAFRSGGLNGDDLWVALADGERKSFSRVTVGNLRPHEIQFSRKDASSVYFLDGDGQLRVVGVGSTFFFTIPTGA